jgi:membrane protease YdiL (CAAX protease family)
MRLRGQPVPLVIFSIAHWTGGWANILIAFVTGAVLTAFYLWRKDLVANMIGHFLVDFIANVWPRLVGGFNWGAHSGNSAREPVQSSIDTF